MGVAYASGLSKNGSWSEPDAVVPVMKHFAAHGSAQGGRNAGAWRGRGTRQILLEELMPFKAAIQLGGVRGVMMAYSSLDDVPAHASPILYDALKEWGYDGFVMADDTGMIDLMGSHHVADSPADAISQWFNAGGQVQFYDWPLYQFLNVTLDLVANGSVAEDTLRSHVRQLLGVKWDLGLFQDPFIPDTIDPYAIVEEHRPLALEAAHKSIVLLDNKNETLPLDLATGSISKIALVGPFIDSMVSSAVDLSVKKLTFSRTMVTTQALGASIQLTMPQLFDKVYWTTLQRTVSTTSKFRLLGEPILGSTSPSVSSHPTH